MVVLKESAMARPFQTFGGEDLYPSAIEKAAAFTESMIINHPFMDGNKRTGMLGMITLLMEYNIQIMAHEDDLYNFIIKISKGECAFEQIVSWLQNNSTQK
jgi:death-on-curing protein